MQRLTLSREAHLSPSFEPIIESFRDRMPEGFEFYVTYWHGPAGRCVVTRSEDVELAWEIIAALEASVTR